MSAQIPFSADMSDTQFRRLRGRFTDLLKANQKAHADVETAKQVAIDAGVTSDEMSAITMETWAFLVACAATDAERCVYFDANDKPITLPKKVKRDPEKKLMLWFFAGVLFGYIGCLTY